MSIRKAIVEQIAKQSIVPKEYFTRCYLCDTFISSYDPTCKKCGLRMSAERIENLALEEEADKLGFDYIYNLKAVSVISLALTILGYLLTLILPQFNFFFKIYFWTGTVIYLFFYLSWQHNHSLKEYSPEEIELIRHQKKYSLIIFSISVILGAVIYTYLLN